MLNISVTSLYNDQAWFHPKVCFADAEGKNFLMTLQKVMNSDFYGPVQWAVCNGDDWSDWSEIQEIPGFGWEWGSDDTVSAICDVVPEFHASSNCIIALGYNMYYRNKKFWNPRTDPENNGKLKNYPVYAVFKDGKWIVQREKLHYADFEDYALYASNCSQRLTLANGRIIVPVAFDASGLMNSKVTTLLCEFDGRKFNVLELSNTLENPVNRGFLEPSVTSFKDKFYLTLRSEDERGYVSVSSDALQWEKQVLLCWEDGTPLIMSTTQQHWLRINGELYLIYTRKNETNGDVFRYRAPLLIARFNTGKVCLEKSTEQEVFPIRRDVNGYAAHMGNFHPLEITPDRAIITVGAVRPYSGYTGEVLLAEIRA